MISFANVLPRRPGWSIALLVVLAGTVIVLGVLQYQWIGRLSEAEHDRLQSRLTASVDLFSDAFTHELVQVCSAFRRDLFSQEPEESAQYIRSYEEWRELALRPELVKAFFVATADENDRLALCRYDEARGILEPAGGSEDFSKLIRNCGPAPPAGGPFDGRLRRIPVWHVGFIGTRPFIFWPTYRSRMPPPRAFASHDPPSGYLFLELNDAFIYGQLLPELSRRVFGASSYSIYNVAVFLGSKASGPVFSTNPQAFPSGTRQFDAERSLLWAPDWRQARPAQSRPGPVPRGLGNRPRLPLIACDPASQWILAVRHQAGSLDQAALSVTKRNLIISAVALFLLTLSIVMIVLSSQRTQRLARLQLEFAAGISHEVRTPLAIISSAGDNLAEGVVDAQDKVREYGSLIRREARRLTDLIEQTLRFAAAQSGSIAYKLRPVDARDLVHGALSELAPIVDEAGFELVREIDEPVPLVLADPDALSRCIQNLVTNALKYGNPGRWIGIRVTETDDKKRPVSISVADHGPGIPQEDLPHIFDPFYQGRSTSGAKSRGVGLGLAITRDMVEAMGGLITVETRHGRGATFTLHLRTAEGDATTDNGTENTPG